MKENTDRGLIQIWEQLRFDESLKDTACIKQTLLPYSSETAVLGNLNEKGNRGEEIDGEKRWREQKKENNLGERWDKNYFQIRMRE